MSVAESPTTGERLSALEAKMDQTLQEVSLLRASFISLEKYLLGHTREIERMKTEMSLVRTVAVWIFAPVMGAFGLGAIAAIVIALKI
jgi:hypothetical protein